MLLFGRPEIGRELSRACAVGCKHSFVFFLVQSGLRRLAESYPGNVGWGGGAPRRAVGDIEPNILGKTKFYCREK